MFLFVTLISLILGSVWLYVWKSLVLASQLAPWLQNTMFAILIFGFLLQIFRWFDRFNFDNQPKLLFITYFILGLMIQLFIGTLLKDIFLLITQNFSHEPLVNGVTFLACLCLNIIGMRTAYKGPKIKNVVLKTGKWPSSQNGFKIAQISDLHVGAVIKKKYVQNVVHLTNSLAPDLIVITGDLGDGEVSNLKNDLEPLLHLKARHGIYYVTGNHEFYWNAEEWEAQCKDLGFTVLSNEGLEIELAHKSLWIGGVPDISAQKMIPGRGHTPLKAMPLNKNKEYYKILLAHQPKSVHEACHAGFDLMMCGHTHNGQFFPINLFVGLFNPYHKNLNLHKDMHVYVNAGTGFWGPPQRLGIPAEITCLMLSNL